MSIVAKIVGRDGERKSRFHSRRGGLLPLQELVRAPAMLVRRIRGQQRDPQPWMARGAVLELDQLLSPQMSLLELGSGTSTVWFGRRTRATVSLEDHQAWADRVSEMTRDVSSVELRRTTSLAAAVLDLGDARFDVAVVDHTATADLSRVDAVRALRDRVNVIVLDDSDRVEYAEVDTLLAGWDVSRFVSLRPSPFQATETTVFRAPVTG